MNFEELQILTLGSLWMTLQGQTLFLLTLWSLWMTPQGHKHTQVFFVEVSSRYLRNFVKRSKFTWWTLKNGQFWPWGHSEWPPKVKNAKSFTLVRSVSLTCQTLCKEVNWFNEIWKMADFYIRFTLNDLPRWRMQKVHFGQFSFRDLTIFLKRSNLSW